MGVPIYIKSQVKNDDVFCIKSQEMLDAVDAGIADHKSNPGQMYESIHLKKADKLDMRVAFYGAHPYAYVYVSADNKYQPLDSRPFDVSKSGSALHDHVAKVLKAH